MIALYAYDPAMDSPNDNPADELAIQQGDIVTVFGVPDGDGYYEVQLEWFYLCVVCICIYIILSLCVCVYVLCNVGAFYWTEICLVDT